MCEYKNKSHLIKNIFLLVAKKYQVVTVSCSVAERALDRVLGDSELTRSLVNGVNFIVHSFIWTRAFKVSSNSKVVILLKILQSGWNLLKESIQTTKQ